MKSLRQFIKITIREFLNEASPNYDYNIDYDIFDDVDNSVWRKLANKGSERDAINYMNTYLKTNKNKLKKNQIGAILWHIGQLYAFINDYNNAIRYMSQQYVQYSIEPNYQLGTIAFLKKDLIALKKYYTILQKKDPTGGSGKNILKRLIAGFGKPYSQVY